ncbi:MAG TPA: transporter substrate-binding domain-containing protein [Spirochaetia bacterium]|nr:transporter substrate-binding domain-containing protein [Spirochaetia bacterium]
MKRGRYALSLFLAACLAVVTVTSVAAQDSRDVQAIKDRGVLHVGVKVDVPKFGYRDPATGKVDGYEIDLARAVAKSLLGDPSKIDLAGVTAKTRGPLLDNGEVDMVIATFTITDERKKSYNFTDPYFIDGVGLMVKKAAGYTSFRDLNGKRIGVAQSATSKKAVQDEAARFGIRVNFSEYNTYPEIRAALDSGRVDCFSVDTSILAGYMDSTTMLLPERFSPQPYGMATKFDNKGLAAYVNNVVAQLKASGENDTLLAKWGLK